jgi:NADH-quinone oxidoreductase subunit G
MANLVTLTIDGKSVTVPAGTLVVDAAKKIGIDIPVFCYHPKMEPAGMCRMCLVELGRPLIDRATGQPVMENGQPKIQWAPKLETACTNVVCEGMVILTQSEKAKSGQHEILEFLLTSHPLDCPVCDKGGECPLQNLTLAHGPGKSRFIFGEKHHAEKHVPLGELIWLDRERCIQCGRCVRFQRIVAGEPVLAFDERGRNTEIITNSEPGFDSVFSGNTTDICPVGALTTADFRFGARPWELKAAASLCVQCPVGCNVTLNTRREAKANGKVVIKRVMPRQNEQVNEIWICDKGRFAYHFTESEARLSKPLVRKDNKLKTASWDAALKLAAERLEAAGKEAVILAGGRLSNEDLFNLKKLADGLGGKALLYSHIGGGDLVAQVGVGQGTNFSDMGKGSTIVVAASDLYEEAPIWWLRVKQAADRGATLIVVNARETRLDKHADYVVRYAPGDEFETLQGLAKKDKLGPAISKAENLVVLYGADGLDLNGSTSVAAACAALLVESKHVGKANNGLIGVWAHANDQGAWELGFRPEADLAAALKGKTVYVAAADPAGDDPALAKALQGAKSVIVQELFQTATAELAEVVLPAAAYTEREGTFTSGERRVQRYYPAIPMLAETKADYAITAEIGKRLKLDLEAGAPALVFDRLAAEARAFAGLSYRKLAEVQEQWPIVGRGDLYYGGTTYENRQGLGAQLVPAAQAGETPSLPDVRGGTGLRPKEDELIAVPVTKLYDRGATVLPSKLLAERIGGTAVGIHPALAKQLGVKADDKVKVHLGGEKAEAAVWVDETIQAGVVLVPRSMGLNLPAPAPVRIEKV